MVLSYTQTGVVVTIPGDAQDELGGVEAKSPVLEYPSGSGVVARVGTGNARTVNLTAFIVRHDDKVVRDSCQLSIFVAPPVDAIWTPSNIK